MLPLQQAREVRDSVIEYIKATFRFKEKDVSDAFYAFLEDKQEGLFKGPYISLKTPFVSATAEESADIPLDIAPAFAPYKHQLQAFHQLSMKDGHQPEPTLLTTGTGSGKTECFLYPILDYCYRCNRWQHQPGVKVIIMYPMNALASDQAKRLAETIWQDERLRGKVTAGLFVGEGIDAKSYPRDMGPDHIIEHRDAILDTVPDILLTNFKMLDYGLMRQNFMRLWRGNIDTDKKALRFIVLDELHTYDGAQGTDVANLLRRLKLKLSLPEGYLCPIGTSATIGNGEDSKKRLCEYASNVFGETFNESNVIEEHRIPVDDFVQAEDCSIPDETLLQDCVFQSTDTVESYLRRLCAVWLGHAESSPVDVGEGLRRMGIVRDLLGALADGVLTLEELLAKLEGNKELINYSKRIRLTLIENLLALVAYAKRALSNGREIPFLYLQVQLWQRELSGILRFVDDEASFTWRGSIQSDEEKVALPLYFCRDCGASGWLSYAMASEKGYGYDVSDINKKFMDSDLHVRLLNTVSEAHRPIEEYLTETSLYEEPCVNKKTLCKQDRYEYNGIDLCVCSKKSNSSHGNDRFLRYCPECNGKDTICEVGGRTATLSSVAISQVLSSDFDYADESNRKILVFTNSVQDAAHHAGFYEARTFRFLFRQSMQEYLKQLNAPVNLVDLQKGFKAYWHEKLSEEQYYYRFLPADLASHVDLSHHYRDGQGFMTEFKEEFETRVDWEITSEFALTAQLGRTLEKTGASASFFRKELIEEVYQVMVEWMNSNNMAPQAEQKEEFCHFVYGILHRMRIRGAVDHPYLEKFRKEKLSIWNLNWKRDGRHFLNKHLGGSMQFPKLVGMTYSKETGEMLDILGMRNDSKQNWYSVYFFKQFNDIGVSRNMSLFNDFMQKLFDVMVELGILNKQPQGGGNYAIRPQEIWVSPNVKHLVCTKCQSRLCVEKDDELAQGTPCLNYRCEGTYSKEESPQHNYYQQVYNRNKSPRVHANEHTGLLERDVRESLEKDFKTLPKADSTNVLVATSTLEMGIDIGDLNVMGNANVPPKTSNFLQRVGRAGRKEGAALVLNYAHAGQPHDMYYFTYPREMMQGEVSTPGCFLEAKDILRRHFLAFCIDSWTSFNAEHILPSRVAELKLAKGDVLNQEEFIVNRLISFINNNKHSLKTNFKSVYGEPTQEALEALLTTIDDGSFSNQIINVFRSLQSRLIHLGEELEQYKTEKQKIAQNDARYEEIEQLISATKKQYHQIQNEQLIEFMTNAGLLPNYAFPETGVKLQAYIGASREEGDKGKNTVEPKSFELIRPASQGIKELAPGNNFYTQKFRLNISGFSTFDWKEALTSMRFCSKCDCVALKGELGYDDVACPKCSSPSWRLNVHQVLKFTNSRSIIKDSKEAVLDDSKEERDSGNYVIKRHLMFHHNGATTSFVMRNAGFGIEYCNNMIFYEVNYGMKLQMGDKVEVDNDKSMSENGFITCKHCGKATYLMSNNTEVQDQHYKFCTHRDKSFKEDRKAEVFEKLYLYRQMQTEAIKILLPVHIMDAQSSIEMFKAGIELGLKSYYKSSPDHLRIDTYSEINMATTGKDYYLVMYDTIPGGTGYLSKLCNPESFTTLLQYAYDSIHDCKCQWERKDGCYHCILTYGNQYNRDAFSREAADLIFGKLISHAKSWEKLPSSVGTIAESGVAEDSELELMFINGIKRMAEQMHWDFEKVSDVDSYRYELRITSEEEATDIKYYIIPQFALGAPYGVRRYTVADFQIICMSAVIEGRDIVELDKMPMWGVFLDGYSYHAQEPNLRFYDDLEKREGIRTSVTHRLFSWTMTWEDVQLFENKKSDWLGENSVTRLVELLKNPQLGRLREMAFGCMADAWEQKQVPQGGKLFAVDIKINENVYEELTEDSSYEEVATALEHSIQYDWKLKRNLTEIDCEEWTDFWRMYNLLQFFPNQQQEHVAEEETNAIVDRDEIKMYYPGLEELVDLLLDNHIPFSYEGDVDLISEEGIVIASAQMILTEQKIAIDPIDESSRKAFENEGYNVISATNITINDIKNS